MAAMVMAKSVLFNLSKAFPSGSTAGGYHSLAFPHNVSRVCFSTSASKYSNQGKHGSQGTDNSYNADPIDYVRDRSSHMRGNAKDSMREGTDRMMKGAQDIKEKAKGTAQDVQDRGSEKAEEMKHKTNEMADKAAEKMEQTKDKAQQMKDNTKEYAQNVKDKAADATESAKENVKEGSRRAADTAEQAKEKTKDSMEMVGEKVKEGTSKAAESVSQTVQGAWEVAKETTQKIKETVVGKDDSNRMNGGKEMDEDVVEAGRKVGNLDHEKRG